jgi:hypothetical protein
MAEDEEGDLAAVLARAKLSKHADKCSVGGVPTTPDRKRHVPGLWH